jgi:hypothetical protein
MTDDTTKLGNERTNSHGESRRGLKINYDRRARVRTQINKPIDNIAMMLVSPNNDLNCDLCNSQHRDMVVAVGALQICPSCIGNLTKFIIDPDPFKICKLPQD